MEFAMHVSLERGISAYILFLLNGHNTLHVPVRSIRSPAPRFAKVIKLFSMLSECVVSR